MAGCPRCQTILVNNQVEEFSVRVCVPCQGLLLPHVEAVKILERSWRGVKQEDAEKLEFRAPANPGSTKPLACPDCRKPMEQYGYMGLAAIPIDRCDACSLLWLDADELQNMVLALAKTNYRSDQARLKEWRSTTDGFVSVAISGLVPREPNSWLFRSQRAEDWVIAEAVLSLFKR